MIRNRPLVKNVIIIFLIMSGVIFVACTGKPDIKDVSPIDISNLSNSKKMLNQILEINKNGPDSISASFTIGGKVKKKKFKSSGKIMFNKNPEKMYALFTDYIFKSPITYLFQNGEDVKIYFPIDKKLIIDKKSKMNLKNYSKINIDFSLIYELLIGRIPLIKDYKINKGLTNESGDISFLILENSIFFETISLKENFPDRIKLTNKANGEEIEIYYRKITKHNKTHLFRKIRVIAKKSQLTINISLRRIKLNNPVKVRSSNDLKIPKGVKVIQM